MQEICCWGFYVDANKNLQLEEPPGSHLKSPYEA